MIDYKIESSGGRYSIFDEGERILEVNNGRTYQAVNLSFVDLVYAIYDIHRELRTREIPTSDIKFQYNPKDKKLEAVMGLCSLI